MRTALLLTILTIPLGCQKFASTGPSGATTGTAYTPGVLIDDSIIDVPDWVAINPDFQKNPIAAEKKWMNRRVRFSFFVENMGKNERAGKFFLSGWRGQISTTVKPSEEDKFASVNRGDQITIVARINRVELDEEFSDPFYDIYLTDAELLEINPPKKK